MLKFVPLSPTNAHHQLLPSETSAITAKNSVVKDGKTEEDDSRVDINKSSKSTEMYTYTPNLLPCRIHADGPVEKRMNAGDGENRHQDVDGWERYWDPQRPTGMIATTSLSFIRPLVSCCLQLRTLCLWKRFALADNGSSAQTAIKDKDQNKKKNTLKHISAAENSREGKSSSRGDTAVAWS